MTKTKKPSLPDNDLDQLAEDYLDFWQDNLSSWATDPQALEKWVAVLSDKKTK